MYVGQLIWCPNIGMYLLSNDREEMISYDHVQIEKKKMTFLDLLYGAGPY